MCGAPSWGHCLTRHKSDSQAERLWPLLDGHYDPLITSEVRRPVIGPGQDDVDRLPALRIVGHTERRLQRGRVSERDISRIGAGIIVLPPLHCYRVPIGI